MTKRLAFVGFIFWLISQGSIVFSAPVEGKSDRFLPFLTLLLDDTIGVLGTAVNIQTTTNDIVSCSRAAFDSNGNAYVIWNQGPNYLSGSVWASRHTSASGWEAAVTIESSPADVWGCPAISADGNGNIVAVWSQSGVIMLNRYLAGSGWGEPETVGGSNGLYPSVAVDANSNLFVVWEESGGPRSIWARRYQAGIGWEVATEIESYTADSYEPTVVVDANGNAAVVWAQQISGLLFSAAANHYTVGSGWGTPVIISTGSESILNNSVVADIDANGNVFAAWSQGSTSTIFTIRVNRYAPGSGWGAPTTLDKDSKTTSNSPTIASASDGAIVVWGKYDSTIHASTFSTNSGWGSASLVASGSIYPNVGINHTGKVTVAWYYDSGTSNIGGIRAIQYTQGSGWGDVQLLAQSTSPSVSFVRMTTGDTGNFLVTWTEGPGPTHNKVMGNLFQ